MKSKLRTAALALLLSTTAPAFAEDHKVEATSAVFMVPDGWKQSDAANLTRVTAPEGDFDLFIVDAGEAKDSATATAAAWKAADPAFARTIRLSTERSASEG